VIWCGLCSLVVWVIMCGNLFRVLSSIDLVLWLSRFGLKLFLCCMLFLVVRCDMWLMCVCVYCM